MSLNQRRPQNNDPVLLVHRDYLASFLVLHGAKEENCIQVTNQIFFLFFLLVLEHRLRMNYSCLFSQLTNPPINFFAGSGWLEKAEPTDWRKMLHSWW